jgi:hypothetical protein
MDECHARRIATVMIVAVAAATFAVVPSDADDRPPCGACIALIVHPSQASLLPQQLNGLDVLIEVDPRRSADAAAAVQQIYERGGHPGLFVTGMPAGFSTIALERVLTVVVDLRSTDAAADALAFELKTRLTAMRASSSSIQLGIAGPSTIVSALLAHDLAPYVDFVVPDADALPIAHPAQWMRSGELADLSVAVKATMRAEVQRWLWRVPSEPEVARRLIDDLSRSASLLPSGLAPTTNPQVRCGAAEAAVFVEPQSPDRVAWAQDCPSDTPVSTEPGIEVVERVQLSERDALIRLRSTDADRFAETVAVSAARRLTVREIIARHQAAAARQNARIDTVMSSGTLTVTFEAPGFPAPVTISSRAVIYHDRTRSEIEQRDIRVNGLAFDSSQVPRLPLIEPERITSPPLTITLGEKYRYRLVGESSVDGVQCFVVAFEPAVTGETLFRGRAWIAADDFGLIRVAGAQTFLRGPIVSSEQTDEFKRTSDGVWLLSRSDISQLYQGAGYRTPIHRVLDLSSHDLNSSGFDARRLAAYRSDSVILRDTPRGYRYLEKEKGQEQRESEVREEASAATRVRTVAIGMIVDPNITRPLPFAGISYVNFNLFNRGGQVNAFFGGTYGQLAFSIPSIAKGRWQIAGRAFGIASSYNDRQFSGGRELYDRAFLQRPAHASVWLVAPLSPRLSLRAGYELDYTHFARSEQTAADFVVPAAQVVNGFEIALEAQRNGWSGTLWWNPARRTGWRTWGSGSEDYAAADRDFQRFGAAIVRPMVITPRLVARGEVAMMAGHDLDRFSQYTFGTFENRLHGYPSALIRYDRGGVLRGALAWSAARAMRVDGFADLAFVRDRGFEPGLTKFAGFGTAVEVPAPFGTLAAVEWGYGPQGVNADGRRGTYVVRVTGYKVF